MLHRFLPKSLTLDLVNFSHQTVFCTFFPNACTYWADFWHVSQSSWLKMELEFRCTSLIFRRITCLRLSKFHWWKSFQTFFYTLCILISCWFLACKSITSVLKSYAYEDRNISYIVKDSQIHTAGRGLGIAVRELFLQKTSPQKLLTGFLRNFTGMFLRWSSFKFLQIIVFYEEFWLPWQSK